MGEIRLFESRDVAQAADLWQRCFRKSQAPATADLCQYFLEVFLGGPWHHPDYRPLVYLASDGAITGFMGRVHRPMVYRGQLIHCAVATQLMVDPVRKQGFCALELVRAFHAGPHDLAYSDGANESSRRLWERCGGQTCRLLSMEWKRPLRRVQSLLLRIGENKTINSLARALQPCSGLVDELAVRAMPRLWHLPRSRLNCVAATPERIIKMFAPAQSQMSLTPVYTPQTLAWLLAKAAESRSFGDLRSMAVTDQSGCDVGWFVYYTRPGQAAQVLQVGALPGEGANVLGSLFRDAWEQGAASVAGQLEAMLLTELSDAHCTFRCMGLGVLMQSRNAELLAAIHRGDAAISRLEGEWWMRFGIDRKAAW